MFLSLQGGPWSAKMSWSRNLSIAKFLALRAVSEQAVPNTRTWQILNRSHFYSNKATLYTDRRCFHVAAWLTSTTPNIGSNTAAEEPDCAKPVEDIPGPKTLPILGTVHHRLKNVGRMFHYLTDQAKVHGGIYREKTGSHYDVVLSHADMIQNFYRRESQFPHRIPIIPWLHWRKKRGKKLGIFLM